MWESIDKIKALITLGNATLGDIVDLFTYPR
jgi:hypothetical protein